MSPILILAIALTTTGPTEADMVGKIAARYALTQSVQIEHVLWDGTRVDILTDDVAYEVDWAKKWAEGCGQALYYGLVTERTPGLILLVRSKDDYRFVYRAQTVCKKYGIRLRVEEVK